jgi:antibiotic biosynthesis monooxygenase (ABM) superfamily enzyme
MIYITQLIYIQTGKENIFHEFEEQVIPMIAQHNGVLMLRCRPRGEDIVASSIEKPYEVHLVRFESEEDLHSYMRSEERKKFVHLKNDSVKSVMLIKGQEFT